MDTKITPQPINGNFKNKDIISIDQFSTDDVSVVFKTADNMKQIVKNKGGVPILTGKIQALLFYEPSSRTFGSFASAMQRLGGGIIPLQGMANSSAAKGETLEDTVKTFSSYSDVIVIRHPEAHSVHTAAKAAWVPVINAGDGINEHPTQALYDLYTIQEELKTVANLHVVFYGELARYRPVNSLAKLLTQYPNIQMTFVSPPQVPLNNEVRGYLQKKNIKFKEQNTIDSVLPDADVLYVTRVKKEFMSEELYKKIQGQYVVNAKTLRRMKKKSIVMHALPRIDEISTDIDSDPRAVYLNSQVKNGLYVRMALLALVLGKIP